MSGGNADERLRTQVERVRALVLRRHGLPTTMASQRTDYRVRVDDVAQLSTVSAHWGIASDVPFVGSVIVLWRRAIRIVLRWYINPIVEQQNRFNHAVVRALVDLQMENDELRAQVAACQVKNEQ